MLALNKLGNWLNSSDYLVKYAVIIDGEIPSE